MKAKKIIALALSTVMLTALFTGCAPKNEPDVPSDKPVDKPVTEKIVRTDIILGESSDVVTTDPHDSTDMYSTMVNNFMYDGLVRYDDDVNILPALAESWENPSPTEYIFKIRKDVKFHNGDTLSASDVKFSIDRMAASPKLKARFGDIDVVTVIDPNTVSVKTKYPSAPLLVNLASPQSLILNEKVVTEAEKDGGKYGAVTPVGTGYMQYKSWQPNDNFVVERFDGYWGGKGETTSITSRVIPEPTSRTIALETGEIDFLSSVTDVDIERVRENKDLQAIDMPGSIVSYLGMNTQKEHLNNVKVRQAISHAVNKQAIIDAVVEGNATVATSPFATVIEGYNADIPQYEFSIEKAKALLTEAGLADGFEVEIVCSGDTTNRQAQMIQSDLSKINITVDIVLLEWGAFLAYAQETKHEMFLVGWGNTVSADATLTGQFHSSSSAASGNRAWYQNPELDSLIEAARGELDRDKRNQIYKDAQTLIMAEAVWCPLYQKKSMIGAAKGFTGAELTTTSTYHRMHNAVVELD